MQAADINAIRTYHPPARWLLDQADEQGVAVFVDVPWPKHLCFLDSTRAQEEARQAVRTAARRGQAHPCILAYSIGNEIPPDVVRWHGARRVERFLAELCDVVRQTDPNGLVTYANYPPTEYLDLSFLDFATFNVYLHDRETFHRYLARLQNLVGDRPLLLGELSMDTFRHGELAQADFLRGHLSEALVMGRAGAFVFSWTDEWHTGGHAIQDWAFGITHADRAPRSAYHALREVFEASPVALLPATPRVSVVVCSYNGGRTLEQCLCSLLTLDYPDYEMIVVDDGSTDDTQTILERFQESGVRSQESGVRSQESLTPDSWSLTPGLRVVHQPNRGLSVARNIGLRLATGSVVAYTDSDCFADTHWLTHLVYQLERSGAAAVGGPNLTPEDGWLAVWPLLQSNRCTSWKVIRSRSTFRVATWHSAGKPWRPSTASTRSTARPATMWMCAGGYSRPATGSASPRVPLSGITGDRTRVPTCDNRLATGRRRRSPFQASRPLQWER